MIVPTRICPYPHSLRILGTATNVSGEPHIISARRSISTKQAVHVSSLGQPVSELAARGTGFVRLYEHGLIAWTRERGAHAVYGAIAAKYAAFDGTVGLLGWPLTDRIATPDGIGCFNVFQGGAIYWSPATGAHELHGPILKKWAVIGWEHSPLGYPISDVVAEGADLVAAFQHGRMHWSAAGGTVAIHDNFALDWQCDSAAIHAARRLAHRAQLSTR